MKWSRDKRISLQDTKIVKTFIKTNHKIKELTWAKQLKDILLLQLYIPVCSQNDILYMHVNVSVKYLKNKISQVNDFDI